MRAEPAGQVSLLGGCEQPRPDVQRDADEGSEPGVEKEPQPREHQQRDRGIQRMLDQPVGPCRDELARAHLGQDQQHRPRPNDDTRSEGERRYRLQSRRWPADTERLRERDVERDPDEHERQDERANAVTAADERPEPRSPAWTCWLLG